MASNFPNDGNTMGDAPTPMTDADITPPPATTDFEPAAPLKNAGVEFESANDGDSTNKSDAATGVRGGAQKLTQQAGEKARGFAETGKERASGALDQFAHMLTDAATTVDEKVGEQYGRYARSAADQVSGFAEQVRSKDVDALLEDARVLVRKSPAVAIGVAAAVGFVLARLVSAGIENKDA